MDLTFRATWNEHFPHQMLYIVADWLLDQGLFDEAIGYYEASLSLNEEHGYAAFGMGKAYLAANNFMKAAESFDRSIAINPDHAPTLYQAALAYEKAGNQALATERARSVLRLNLLHAPAFTMILQDHLHRNNYDEAIRLTEPPLQESLSTPLVVLMRSLALAKSGEIEKSRAALESISIASRNRNRDLVKQIEGFVDPKED